MAALSAVNPTLLDLAKMTDPNGQIATVAELLTQVNEMLDDMTWVEGNLTSGNRSTIRTGLPTPTWRKLYGGVQPTKGITAQVTDNCGMLEAFTEVDKALADLNGNTAAFRMQSELAHLQGINNEIQRALIFASEATSQTQFTGLAPRFNSLSAANAQNIIVGDGAGTDNASIWLVYWGPMTVHGIVPKGSTAGLQRKDFGEVVIENADGAGGRMVAYRSHYRFDAGLSMPDWRGVVRICNIDKSNLTKNAATGTDLPDLMFQALELVPASLTAYARPAFYMSRNTMSFLRRQLANKTSGSTLSITDVGGRKVMDFQGVPIRRVDALAADEALVS